MSGLQPYGGGKVERRQADLYPTHPSAPEAFLRAEAKFIRRWSKTVFEPACGPGMLARVIEHHGFRVIARDLHPWGYGKGGHDFLECKRAPCSLLVTNPPYGDLAEAFIRHAVVTLRMPYVALLLKADYWHAGKKRAPLFRDCAPSLIYPLGWRLHWDGRGRPVTEFSWNVWDVSRPSRGHARYTPCLKKPESWPDVGFADWLRQMGLSCEVENMEGGVA